MYKTFVELKRRETVYVTGLVAIHYYEFGKAFSFPEEHHDCWEMGYVDRGSMDVVCNGVSYTMRTGQMLLYPPMAPHAIIRTSGAVNSCGMAFTGQGEFLHRLAGRLINLPETLQKTIGQVIAAAYRLHPDGITMNNTDDILVCANPEIDTDIQLIFLYMEEFFLTLSRMENNRLAAPHKAATLNARYNLSDEVIRYVRENISRPITSSEVCSHFSIGQNALYRTIKATTGAGLMELILRERLDVAKVMIREEQYNFTEIAERLGFTNLHYFSAWFKKMAGSSPTEYASSVKTKYSD